MSTSVLVAIAGLMVTAVGTGLLGGRCIRSPRPSYIAWAIGMFALTVALLAQSIGFATGFGAVTFRVIQISAQLVAPVALAWGLVELVARGAAARFGARLAAAGLVVVVGVILATDPLTAKPFGTVWPSAAVHYQLIPHYALIGLHLALVAVAATAVALCAARVRGRPADGQLLPGAAAVGGAVLAVVALRFGLPADAAYPALSAVSGGLVWFGMTRADGLVSGVTRPRAVPSRDTGTGHYGRAARRRGPSRVRRRAVGERAGGERAGESGQRESGQRDERTAAESAPAGARPAGRRGRREPGGAAGPVSPACRRAVAAARRRRARMTGPPEGAPAAARRTPRRGHAAAGDSGRPGAPGPHGTPGAEPATAAIGRPGSAPSRWPAPGEVPPGAPAGGAVRPVTRPYGLIAIYTLLEDRVADFDRVAEQAAEQVRASEPDTLVYVIHTVPKAPMQRIFYEVYRDRAAYEHHEQQSYVKRFVTARRPYVLATNVIELRLKYAKVSPLVQAEAPVRAPAGARARGPAASPGARPRAACAGETGPPPVRRDLTAWRTPTHPGRALRPALARRPGDPGSRCSASPAVTCAMRRAR